MKRKELEKIAKEDEKIAEFARKKELQMNKRQQIQTERHRYEEENDTMTGTDSRLIGNLTHSDANSRRVSK